MDDSDLPTTNKFTYLKSLLTGEAKETIAGMALTTANYNAACELLKDRFGRPDRIIFGHVQGLLAVECPVNHSVSDLWTV